MSIPKATCDVFILPDTRRGVSPTLKDNWIEV
jgi:hypothetical protein